MHYQTNKNTKLTNNASNYIKIISPEQKGNTIQPKTTVNSKNENFTITENSENTIYNINPLSKSKDSISIQRNSSQSNIFYAVECNDLEKVEQLLKNDNSKINDLNEEGLSVLHIAVIKGNLKMINLLLKYGANSNILSEKKKQSPLHLAYLNQNSMTEEIIQELKNNKASDSICDYNNKHPSDYLNNSYLKNYNNGKNNNLNSEDNSSIDKKQAQSNSNTVMVITNENHFDSFLTTNKEDDNKSNVTSTINNNNTVHTPAKLEATDNNEYDYNNEPTITINSNNKYNTNNTNNSKSDSINRRQYTFGKEEDFKFQNNKNSEINANINNSIKDIDINYNNINNNNGGNNKMILNKLISKDIEEDQKDQLSDSLEDLNFKDNSKNKNNIYINENIHNADSFTKNNGYISNSILTYTDSVNVNNSTPRSKKNNNNNTQISISNSINSNLKNVEEIELKLPHTLNNSNNTSKDNNFDTNNHIKGNITIDINNINISPNSNIDEIYKKIILKKRDSIIKSHLNCNSGIEKYEKKHIYMSDYNSQNSNNINKTIIHNTSKDINSSFRNITVIHNNNYNMNSLYDTNTNNNSYYKDKEIEGHNIALFTTKSQTGKVKGNTFMTNEGQNNIILYKNNNSNNNSFMTNNNSENNNKNISEFKYIDSYTNNNIINSNYMNNSNDNSNININDLINEDISDKNVLSSLKYWLNNLELINYYPNFVNRSIINISNLIEKMKSYQTKFKYEDIESILRIRKPGHIYRILCRLEVDANLIDNKVTKFLLKNDKIFNQNELYVSGGLENSNNNNNLHLLISQDYQCFGCCKANRQFANLAKNDLKSFLKRYGLLNYYQNFHHNGFDLIEYVILQMYGGYPINDDILENCFHVYEEEQRKRILKAIVNEMKKINEFLVSDEYNNNQNNEFIKYQNVLFCDDGKNIENAKIKIYNDKSSNCSIF